MSVANAPQDDFERRTHERLRWRDSLLGRRLGVRLPIIQAPMSGGASTARLTAAVSEAGGLGSVAGGLLPPDDLRAAIRDVRALTDRPFAVNLFASLPVPSLSRAREWAELTGAQSVPSPPAWPRFEDQLAVVIGERVPVFSFTFGIPELPEMDALVVGTATTVAEAAALDRSGVDAVIAQGYEAGGHRATFLASVEDSLIATMALVPHVVDAVSIPVIAAGGIMDGRGVAAAFALGAQAVTMGTAFLGSAEAGISEPYRAALGSDTTITAVMTGRHARVVRTPLVDQLEASGLRPPDPPLPLLLAPEDPVFTGQAGGLARFLPAEELVRTVGQETDGVLRQLIGDGQSSDTAVRGAPSKKNNTNLDVEFRDFAGLIGG
jgi:nitronate monooxygenase